MAEGGGNGVLAPVEAMLAARLEAMRARHAALADPALVAEVVREVLGSLSGDLNPVEAKLLGELESLGQVIVAAKREIAALRVDDITDAFIPSATDEMDAIVEDTAKATHNILDACERIEGVLAESSPSVAEKLQDATTRIYEACSFQDITGQRIGKVVRTLKTIEDRIAGIVAAFGQGVAADASPDRAAARGTASVAASAPAAATGPAAHATSGETALLNGPQLPGAANDQAEIDRLLASM